ncbi:MAG: aquaporin [Mycobacterium sp.]|jgi:aquaporin Z|nr:aquaporin [Mycobacterium sp.]
MVTSPAPTQALISGAAAIGRGVGAKYVVEAIGTFLLVFAVGAAVASGSTFAPLGIGAALMVMVYVGAYVAGGHYNPAVTLAVLVRRRIGLRDAFAYWLVQIGSGLLAAVLVRRIFDPALGAPSAMMMLTRRGLGAAFVAELLFTFALCYVVLNVATSSSHSDKSYYGVIFGFTVFASAVAIGTISGGALDSAVPLGTVVMDIFGWPTLWVYLMAQMLAGLAAGVTFLALNADDR